MLHNCQLSILHIILFLPYSSFYLTFGSFCLLCCFFMQIYSFLFGFLLFFFWVYSVLTSHMKLDSPMLLQDQGMWNHWRTLCWMKLRKRVRRSFKLTRPGVLQQAHGRRQGTVCVELLYLATLSCILVFDRVHGQFLEKNIPVLFEFWVSLFEKTC